MSEWLDRHIMKLVGGFMVVALAWLGYIIGGATKEARVQAHCLALGWTDGKADWRYTGYCVARENQTDVVVPWKQAKQR